MNGPLWTLKEIAGALGADYAGADMDVSGVSIDSRTLFAGEVFVALSGTPSGGFKSSFNSAGDGHNFVKAAADKGAVAAVVSRVVEGVEIPQLVVSDTLMDGLWKLGAAARARFGGKVVGLTGSAGKTSTKELLGTMLGACGEVSFSVGSYNNFWGVPLSLARMPREADYAVLEMGMNQVGEIARLSALVRPDVALVVNVKPVHLEHLGSLEAIAREKFAIAEGLGAGGVLVYPREVAHDVRAGVGVLTFGEGGEVRELGHEVQGDDWQVRADVAGHVVEFVVREAAPHKVLNTLAALACVQALGADVAAAAGAVAGVGALAGRGAVTEAGGVLVVDDSFNANPASVTAALQSLKVRKVVGRRIAVLGDMLELGAESARYHRGMAAVCEGLDGVFCVGPLMKNCYEALPEALKLGWHEEPATLAAGEVAGLLRPGDRVVVKGSKKIFYVHGFVGKLVAALKERGGGVAG